MEFGKNYRIIDNHDDVIMTTRRAELDFRSRLAMRGLVVAPPVARRWWPQHHVAESALLADGCKVMTCSCGNKFNSHRKAYGCNDATAV